MLESNIRQQEAQCGSCPCNRPANRMYRRMKELTRSTYGGLSKICPEAHDMSSHDLTGLQRAGDSRGAPLGR